MYLISLAMLLFSYVLTCVLILYAEQVIHTLNWQQVKSAWRVRWSAALAQSGRASASADSIRPRSSRQIQGRWATLRKNEKSRSRDISALQSDPSSVNTVAPNQVQRIDSVSPTDTSTASPLPVLDKESGYEIRIPVTESATTKKKRGYESWTASATDEFSRLYESHYKRHCAPWSYGQFTAVWDTELHGEVTQTRWKGRNQTEERRREKQQARA
jgi:hypothetical protein